MGYLYLQIALRMCFGENGTVVRLHTDGSALSDQLLESTTARILQLESENKRLAKQLALLRDSDNRSTTSKTAIPSSTKPRHITNGISDTADTNAGVVGAEESPDVRRLRARVVALQNANENLSALETRVSLVDLENRKLARKADCLQEAADALERENGRLIGELERVSAAARGWSETADRLESEKAELQRSVERLESAAEAWRRRGEGEPEHAPTSGENPRSPPRQRRPSELGETPAAAAAADAWTLEVEAEMAAELLRANVRLEGERDRAQDDADRLTTQLKELGAELDDWRTEYQRVERQLDDAQKRLADTQLDYSRISSKYEVRVRAVCRSGNSSAH